MKEDEHYDKFLGLVKGRPRGVPLLTVSNHCSPLDDPGVLVGMLPASVTVRPELMRWTICAQEICFKWISAGTGFGSAKVRVFVFSYFRVFVCVTEREMERESVLVDAFVRVCCRPECPCLGV